jgi:hypothetical protein
MRTKTVGTVADDYDEVVARRAPLHSGECGVKGKVKVKRKIRKLERSTKTVKRVLGKVEL